MGYQVLARKWRPSNFTEVVGQEHVVKSLVNAIQHDRLHHAYLFTGTRGVGKTTLARIFAKAINCSQLQGFNPCGQCDVCQSIAGGYFLDLIEVDAASRTGVEDTRELLDNAQYAPHQGRYKVYLIDEVHMLSGHSFNALLKTLEEPPIHVKFLLATTDPQKIPVTVLSRCLQFNLKRLLPGQIFAQMSFILQQEQIDAEPAALQLLSRAADGSMRDALSLLDQSVAMGNGQVDVDSVSQMLGTMAQQPIEVLLMALAEGNTIALMQCVDSMASLAPDFADVLRQMLQIFHRIAMLQQVPTLLDSDLDTDGIQSLVDRFSAEDIQLFYQIGLLGQRDLDLAPDPRSGFEMVLLRMLTFKPVQLSSTSVSPETRPLPLSSTNTTIQPKSSESPPIINQNQGTDRLPDIGQHGWAQMIATMKISGLTRELANNCLLQQIDDNSCILTLDAAHKQLRSRRTEDNLQKALQAYRGTAMKLVINIAEIAGETPAAQLIKQREDRQQMAVEAIEADENIRALKEQLGARVLPGSIEPI